MNLTAFDIRRGARNPRSSSILGLMGLMSPLAMLSQGKLRTGCGYPGTSGERIVSTRTDVSKDSQKVT